MATTAYLVGWYDTVTNRFTDAGVYSEETPTSPDLRRTRSMVLLAATSRFSLDRALRTLYSVAESTPRIAWAVRQPTYLRQRASFYTMEHLRRQGVGMFLHGRAFA